MNKGAHSERPSRDDALSCTAVYVVDKVVDMPVVQREAGDTDGPDDREDSTHRELYDDVPIRHILREIVDVMRIALQERAQQRAFEQIVDVPVPRVFVGEDYNEVHVWTNALAL